MNGKEIEPFDVDQFFSENARRRNRANLAERLADWIRDYGDHAPWDEADNGNSSLAKSKSPQNTTKKKTTVSRDKDASKQVEGATLADDDATKNTAFIGKSSLTSSHLYQLLDKSGKTVVDRRRDLQERGEVVYRSLVKRAGGDSTEFANAFRVWVGVFWLGIAAWLYVQTTNAKIAESAVTASGIPLSDAAVMMPIYALLGILAALAGLAIQAFGAARKSFSNDDLINTSENYGHWIATLLAKFDEDLSNHRRKLSDTSLSNDAVLREVSEAHITAEEAVILFNEVPFLVEDDEPHHSGLGDYRKYLNDCGLVVSSADTKSSTLAGFIIGAIWGIVVGGIVGGFVITEVLGIDPDRIISKLGLELPNGFNEYPIALFAVIIPTSLLLMADVVGDLLSTGLSRGRRQERLGESLRAIRGAITAAQAPRARDIAQRVEDLSEIFRVRLAKVAGGGGNFADEPVETPSWRNRDDSPRFVNTGFASAPKPFLADPVNAEKSKKFAPIRETKRGLFGLGKPRRP